MNSVSDLIQRDFVTANGSRILFRGEDVSLLLTFQFRTGLAACKRRLLSEQFAPSSLKLQKMNTDVVIKFLYLNCLSTHIHQFNALVR